eukprot:CCRYP_006917-RA/>CCRYP_006917-RA protein AED:0.37 eAED:0.37 QI:0/0/0/1/1/1/2/0/226
MIVDGAKEMKMGEFAWKCKEAHCYLRSTEPYSPWSNSAEHEIWVLKKGAAQKMMRSGAPQRLWCFALEYESYVRLHTAHDIYRLDGRVPETIAPGETADVSPFCEFGFWDWELAQVLRRKRDAKGNVVGSAHHNPALDTRVYEVRFPDGHTKELDTNVIAEAVYAQCDADGNQYVLRNAIVDYQKDPSVAVARDDQVTIVDGKNIIKRSTCGWELCCEWKDDSTSW